MSASNFQKILYYMGFFIFASISLFLFLASPPWLGLEELGRKVLAGTIFTIGLWILKPNHLPFAVGSCFLIFYLLLLGITPSNIFSGFTGTAIWTLIPALFFGYVLIKTELGEKIAFIVLRLTKSNYPMVIISWFLIGIVLSILTPSITVRVSIVIPIAIYYSKLYSLKAPSKGNDLILLTAFAMALIPGTGWLTGSLWGPIIQGFYNANEATSALINFQSWFQINFLPIAITTILMIILGYFLLKPKEKLNLEKVERIQQKITKNQFVSLIILGVAFLFFLTNSFHGIPDVAICLLALALFFAFGILEAKEFSSGISWDLIFYVGTAIGLGNVFSITGVSDWLGEIVINLLQPLSGNIWAIIYLSTVVLFLWRFIDISFLPTIALIVPVLPTIESIYGINPLVFITILVMVGNCFFVNYQNMWALMAQSIARKYKWQNNSLAIYGLGYFIACMIALAIAIPTWKALGML